MSAFAATAARIAMGAGLLFVVLLGVLHILEPEFAPTWRFVSEYQLGTSGWMMHLAFGALAVSLAASGVAMWNQARNWLGYIGNIVLFIAALGIAIAAIWTTDPIQTAAGAMTFSGTMHVFGASLDYTPVAMLLLSFSVARYKAWRSVRTGLFVAAGVCFALMFAFIGVLPKDGVFGPEVYAGLVGRLLLVSYLGWILLAGSHILRLKNGRNQVK